MPVLEFAPRVKATILCRLKNRRLGCIRWIPRFRDESGGSRGWAREHSDFQERRGTRDTLLALSKDSNIRDRNTAGGFARGTRDECLRKRYMDTGFACISVPLPCLYDGGRRRLRERPDADGRGREEGGEKHLLRTSVNTRCSVYFRTTSPVSYYIRIANPRSLSRHAACHALLYRPPQQTRWRHFSTRQSRVRYLPQKVLILENYRLIDVLSCEILCNKSE